MTDTIEKLHRGKIGKVSDKWSSYLKYYDTLMNPLKEEPVSLLEIGVQNGGSLETWSRYFQNGENFIGCDIDPNCGKLQYDDPRIKVIVGDANIIETLQAIKSVKEQLDIVIDDGSHRSIDILNSFVNYFPMVKPGGVYIIEDTHTLYQMQFGGGIMNDFSAYAFFKKLIDVIGFQFWSQDLAIATMFQTFFPIGQVPEFINSGWIESIEFRNSIITIRKSLEATHNKLGDRVLVGDSAQVQTWGGTFVPAEPQQ